MANTITDNRTLLIANDTTDAGLVDGAGAASGASDVSNFIEGNGSWGKKVSATVDEMMYDAGSAQDWSNNHFYIWAACSFPIATFATGGLRIRFCGATVTDYFEKNVRGVDTGYSGGFECLVVDIEKARADAIAGTDGAIGGVSTPATTAIRYVGVVFDVPGMVSGNFNNCNVDAMWRLPSNTPGILVEGQDQTVSAHDWNMNDIFQAGDPGDTAKAWGTIFFNNGVYTINTPIRFGTNDATTHGFSDTNIVVAWEDNLVADDFYNWDIIGGTGIQSFELGIKTGTGDDATGAQGLTMVASTDGGPSSYGVRYAINANDANLDAANFYGCSFIHGGDFVFDDVATSVISTLFNDCSSALVSNAADFLRNSIVNANTLDGVAFATTDDLADIVSCTFEFSDGHAIELTGAAGSYTLTDTLFTGYGADATNDAALYVSAASGTFTINVSNATTERSPTATVNIVLSPVVTKLIVQDTAGTKIENARALVLAGAGGTYPSDVTVTITRVTTTASVAHTAHGLANGDLVVIEDAIQNEYNGIQTISNVSTNAYDYTVAGSPTTPATGTIKSTTAFISDLTDVNGEVSDTRTFVANQPLGGRVRKSSGSPYYKTAQVVGTTDKDNGVTITIVMLSDE
jgi:hypothetical protein